MTFIALSDTLNLDVIGTYLETIGRLSSMILNPTLEPVLKTGDSSRIPELTEETVRSLMLRDGPIEFKGARAIMLSVRGEPAGYFIVAVKTEAERRASDFAFELLDHEISVQMAKNEAEFDAAYMKSMVKQMQRISQRLSNVFDSAQAAEIVVKECARFFAVSTAAVLTLSNVEEDGKRRFKKMATFGNAVCDQDMVSYVCMTGKILLSNDPATDTCFASVNELGGKRKESPHRNIMLVPMPGADGILGTLFLADKELEPFNAQDQRLAQTLAVLLGNTISNIHLHDNVIANERVKSNLERYLSPNLVEQVIANGGMQKLGGVRTRVAVLFSDIRGFTRLSEQYSPEEMVAQLNEYFEAMSRIIFANDGTLDKFVGDMIMVLFGAPKTMPNSAVLAVKTAIEMQQALYFLNEKWVRQGRQAFHVGIGINMGDVVFGNIGSTRAMGMTVIGDNVNVAQRLESRADGGEILISHSMFEEIQGMGFDITKLDLIEVKGKTQKIQSYLVTYKRPERPR